MSENYASRNYDLKTYQINPKISYLFNKNASWDIFYEYQNKENRKASAETLLQNRFGTSFSYSGEKKITINGEFSLYQNKFDGDALSPVAFQMLEDYNPEEI
jgi:translation initiation factor 2 beta subunit (eIF-2beta)/eIF-5